MRRTYKRRGAGLWLALSLLGAAAPACATQPQPAADTKPGGATVDGFRSAHFGMDEASVRKAITSDFGLAPAAMQTGENPVTHTTDISVVVPGLIGGLGKAVVQYVLGYQSHRLTQVAVIWDKAADPANTAPAMVRTAGSLQSYFLHEGFPASKIRGNFIAGNGDFVLVRATDAQNHMVLLALQGSMSKDKTSGKMSFAPRALTIGYIADTAHPDIFDVPKGAF